MGQKSLPPTSPELRVFKNIWLKNSEASLTSTYGGQQLEGDMIGEKMYSNGILTIPPIFAYECPHGGH